MLFSTDEKVLIISILLLKILKLDHSNFCKKNIKKKAPASQFAERIVVNATSVLHLLSYVHQIFEPCAM